MLGDAGGACCRDVSTGQLSGAVPEGPAQRTLAIAAGWRREPEHRMFQKTEKDVCKLPAGLGYPEQ